MSLHGRVKKTTLKSWLVPFYEVFMAE